METKLTRLEKVVGLLNDTMLNNHLNSLKSRIKQVKKEKGTVDPTWIESLECVKREIDRRKLK